MKLRPKTAISEFFSEIEYLRIERQKRHKLIDIITITIQRTALGRLKIKHSLISRN